MLSKSVDVGPNYATNSGWVLLKLQYTLGSIQLSVGNNVTTLATTTLNSELLAIDLSGGSRVILGRNFDGCIEQVTGLLLDNAESWNNVEWGACPLETQQGCSKYKVAMMMLPKYREPPLLAHCEVWFRW